MRNATRLTLSTAGIMAGVAGIEHGIGEMLQGNVSPDGVVILSWPGSDLFRILAGEPALTIIPNLFLTGILAIIASLAFLVWVTMFIDRKHGGLVLMLLSIVMLLVGGGFGPPLVGIIIGVAATTMGRPLTWWRTHLPIRVRRVLARLWPWVFGVCVAAWLLLMPGSLIIGYLLGVNDESLAMAIFVSSLTLLALGSLVLSIVAGCAHDIERQIDTAGVAALHEDSLVAHGSR
jgi:hypothetical protein